MALRALSWAERPDLADRGLDDVWPEYNHHGDVMADWWEPMLDLTEFQFVLYDEDADLVVGEGHTGPLVWDGDDATLPGGIDAALRAAVTGRREGRAADTLCAFAAELDPGQRSRGLAAELLRGMTDVARRHGLRRLIAPVRPSWKERYPLVPIERYMTWRRDDGLLLDPWMRVHERLGGRVAAPLPRSMRISGTVAEWESWTGMTFPESGDYVFPHGLALVSVDRAADVGVYWEPNVWMVHPELD
jgi:GNAT superfamily N-acetyltransferase